MRQSMVGAEWGEACDDAVLLSAPQKLIIY